MKELVASVFAEAHDRVVTLSARPVQVRNDALRIQSEPIVAEEAEVCVRLCSPPRVDEPQARVCEERRGRVPGRMDQVLWQLGELGHPPPDVVAVRVATLGGIDRMHHKPPLVHARAAAVLPHVRVDRGVRVCKSVVEPRRAVPPVQSQVLHQKRSDDVPQIVRHPAPDPELAHGRVDQREAREADLPRAQRPAGAARRGPLERGVLLPQRRVAQVREAPERPVRQVAPAQPSKKRLHRMARKLRLLLPLLLRLPGPLRL
mmetsp:Transcript_3355/g.12187  ORF Transcript_3355/g.12187 Transcript_3355/m.12187 type:complete len:260 (+) Transcript_3355:279-1058(+)